MKRVLFLDDQLSRCSWAAFHLDAVITHQAADCCNLLADNEWDELYLDHDLGGGTFEPSDEFSGMGVVEFLEQHRLHPKMHIVVHSLNGPAAELMVARLRDAGYEVERCDFLNLKKRHV